MRLSEIEYENLRTALDLALDANASIQSFYQSLSGYLDAVQDHERALELGSYVSSCLERYPAELPTGDLGLELIGVVFKIGNCQIHLNRFDEAGASYQRALALHNQNPNLDPGKKRQLSAPIYHQLGRVAEEQRHFDESEQYYKKDLEICIEFNDRYGQATTYHQLGRVAEEQLRWDSAKKNFLKALELIVEFNDEHSVAVILTSIARLWGETQDNILISSVASILSIPDDEAKKLLDKWL